MPKIIRRKNIESTPKILEEMNSWAPDGWNFFRAGFCTSAIVDGTRLRNLVRVYFAKTLPKPGERRPKLRLLSIEQLKAHNPQILAAVAAGTGGGPDSAVVDCLLPDSEVKRLFNLGEGVKILGVRTNWDPPFIEVGGVPVKSTRRTEHGVCVGFSVRCIEPAS